MTITVKGGELPSEEINKYVDYIKEANPDKEIDEVTITIDNDYVDIDYTFLPVRFQRIRRITGYLVGTLDRFNNGKRAEVEDRVKHSLNNN